MEHITSFSLEAFEKTLSDMHENLQQFITILEAEKQFLEKSKYEDLEASLAAKRLLVQSLEEISLQCQKLFSNANFPFNESSMKTIISQFPEFKQKHLLTLWHNIKSLLKKCDQKNLVNGIIITTLKITTTIYCISLHSAPKNLFILIKVTNSKLLHQQESIKHENVKTFTIYA